MEEEYSRLQVSIAEAQSLMVAYMIGQRNSDQPRRYEETYEELGILLNQLGISNPNPHKTLQEFAAFCKLRHLDHYDQRRDYVEKLYQQILNDLFEDAHHEEPSYRMQTKTPVAESELISDKKRVFVVHGRNNRLRSDFFAFLRALHLEPIEWSEAIAATGEASPYIGDVLSAAFSQAQAIVVLMTPDDSVVLKKPFQNENDEPYEKTFFGQARPNVLFEAGLAFGHDPKRTVIVQVGKLKPFSDIHGRHIVRLDDSSERRQEVANRLRTAGCAVCTEGSDWLSVGTFLIKPEEEEEAKRMDGEQYNLIQGLSEQARLQMEKNLENLNYYERFKEKEAENSDLKNELEKRKRESNWGESIRKGNNPLSIWFKRTIRGNPGYVLSASRKELEILVANTFAEEKSDAFIQNAKKLGMVDDKLHLTERGFSNLIAAAKALSSIGDES
jgi:predicted nucleotide-binding protein